MSSENATKDQMILPLLRAIPGLEELADRQLLEMISASEYRSVARGGVLINAGEDADNLYIVLKGRFVVLVNASAVAEIVAGQPIGELAFFAGGKRTADVVAARNSAVLCLTRNAYDRLVKDMPALSNGIITALSQRLTKSMSSDIQAAPSTGKICSIFPALDTEIAPEFADRIRAAFENSTNWRVLDADSYPANIDFSSNALAIWFEAQEAENDNLLVICARPKQHSRWCEIVASNSDTVLIAAPKNDDEAISVEPSTLERELMTGTLKPSIQLALYRSKATDSTEKTARYLEQRPVALHHHIALDTAADFARLGRFIRGEATGLVLCGGGSFGTAHLGVIKALQERGYAFDFVGGTSVGAAMAAALSIGFPPDQVIEVCEDIFIKSKAMSRFTLPKISFLDHRLLDAALKRSFGSINIEDTPINFFAVATSLTHNDASIMRSGSVWKSIRASTSLPGVFPPFIADDGEVLIDGALLDNVPVTVMRDLKPGPNLVLNFLAGRPWRSKARYEDLPTRFSALKSLFIKRKRGTPRHPTIFSLLSRSMVVNARKLLEQTDMGTDILMNISTLRGMSFLDWSRGRELFDYSYKQMSMALDQLPELAPDATEAEKFERLRIVAEKTNSSSPL